MSRKDICNIIFVFVKIEDDFFSNSCITGSKTLILNTSMVVSNEMDQYGMKHKISNTSTIFPKGILSSCECNENAQIINKFAPGQLKQKKRFSRNRNADQSSPSLSFPKPTNQSPLNSSRVQYFSILSWPGLWLYEILCIHVILEDKTASYIWFCS